MKFELLTVFNVRRCDKTRQTICDCKCKCGKITSVTISKLKSGWTRSCGCLLKKQLAERSITHGLSGHPLFRLWIGIRSRCYNKNMDNYPYYGGKGVKMCDEWLENFKTFYDWAIAAGWKKGLQIDKDIIPKKLGIPALLYSPDMCCFVTRRENMNSMSRNRLFEVDGESLTMRQISDKYNLPVATLKSRIADGWTIHRAIQQPFRNTSPSLP